MPMRLILFILLSSLWAGPAFAQFGPTGSKGAPINNIVIQTMMTKYYERPDGVNVKAVLRIYEGEAKDRNAMPPIIGFMAGLFLKYPNKVDSFLPEKPTAFEMSVISSAMRLAGLNDRLRRLQEVWGGPAQDVLTQSVPQRLAQLKPANADGLDVLWGAFFATGETRYVQPILDTYARFANLSDQQAADVLTFGRFMETRGDPASLRAVFVRYPEVERPALIIASTALWGLKANARTHAPVARFLTQYEAKQASKPAGKALKIYRAG
jgi:hypothetical protein